MREIKFRLWSTSTKSLNYHVIVFDASLNEFLASDEENVWSQSIGIKDIDGQDMYEGDLCKLVLVDPDEAQYYLKNLTTHWDLIK